VERASFRLRACRGWFRLHRENVVPNVEVYEKDDMKPLFEGDFTFLPRVGETISKDVGGYFDYCDVVPQASPHF